MNNELNSRRDQLLEDYPELISKLSLLVCAGLSINNALNRIQRDYKSSHLQNTKYHYLYIELDMCLSQIENGQSEITAYNNLANRIGIPCYIKLFSILSQSLQKGAKELKSDLSTESILACDEHKRNVLRHGEKSATKLLLPMMMLFFMIMILIIVPAFLGMTS